MKRIINLINNRWYVFASLLTAYIYFRVAPLQVDPHHDGIILGAAVAVADGHPILSGAFSQYGPLPPLIQGFVLWLFNTQLLTLRFMTAIECLAIGLVLYRFATEFTTRLFSKLISFTWLLASCVWVTQFPGALRPWPSLLSTLFVLCAIILLIKSEGESNTYFALLAGMLFGLAGFCRIQAFILLPLIIAFSLLKFRKKIKMLAILALGYFTSVILIFMYLVITGGVDDFIQQVIITPLFVYSAVGKGNNYNRFQFVLYLIETIGFVVLFFLTKYIVRRIGSNPLRVGILTLIMACVHSFGIWITNTSIPIRLKVLVGEPLQNLVISPFYFAAVSSVFLAAALFFKSGKDNKKLDFPQAVMILCAFGTLPQLYPQPDVMHLWWIVPIFLPCLFILLRNYQIKSTQVNSKTLQTILISCMILGTISAIQFIDRPWAEYKLGVLEGTYAPEEKARSLDIFQEIGKVAITGETSFDCPDGVYSVANGTYLAADQWFVNWGYGKKVTPEVGSTRVICDQSREYAISESTRLAMDLIYFKSNVADKSIAILKKRG